MRTGMTWRRRIEVGGERREEGRRVSEWMGGGDEEGDEEGGGKESEGRRGGKRCVGLGRMEERRIEK